MASKPVRLKSGNWNTQVRLPNGRRKSFTDPLKGVVVDRAREFEAALRRGQRVDQRDRRMTLSTWHTKWLKARAVEASTGRKNDSSWRNHIEPRWGHWTLESISRLEVQTWVTSLTKAGVGPGAVHTAYQLLGVMLTDAADHGLIDASPCRRITLPRESKPEPRWLSRDEYDRLQLALGAATTTLGGRTVVPDPHAPVWQALVGLGCFSGLRPGELAGLDIPAIDFDRRLVRVTQVMTRLPDGTTPDGRTKYRMGLRSYPKSDRSIRSVPFPEEVADLLWRIVADRGAGPVFPGHKGGRLQYEGNFRRRVWLPALERAGIEAVRPYVMRHTCCSWLVQKGVPDRKIMAILGHADAHLIDVYGHLAPEEHDDVRAAWGEVDQTGRRMNDARRLASPEGEQETRRSDANHGATDGR